MVGQFLLKRVPPHLQWVFIHSVYENGRGQDRVAVNSDAQVIKIMLIVVPKTIMAKLSWLYEVVAVTQT